MTDAPVYVGIFEGHADPAAAIVRDGSVVAFAEEERFLRQKHAFGMYPATALRQCLAQSSCSPESVKAIAINWDVESYTNGAMAGFFDALNHRWKVDSGTLQWQNSVLKRFNRATVCERHAYQWRRLFGAISVPPIVALPHHYVHALHAYLQSPFEEALCLTIDGSGDRHCTVLWNCRGSDLIAVREITIPHSLGWFYAAFTEYLGFSAYDGEYKVMGLAAYGQADESLRNGVNEILGVAEDGVEYRLDPKYIHYGKHTYCDRFTDDLVDLFKHPMRRPDEPVTCFHRNLAYAVQAALEDAVCRLVRWGVDQFGCRNVCIGGGVGLNVKMNSRIRSLPAVQGFFAQPLCADGGAAAGAALGACWHDSHVRPHPLETLALGYRETDESIAKTLNECKIRYERPENLVETIADAITAGEIIGWYQGAMEAGPRALGQRSILADPRHVSARDRINDAVKHREEWRPFCPSMPAEDAALYLIHPMDARFMNVGFTATELLARRAPAVVHVDGTVRPQLVHASEQPLFHSLLRAVERRTGVAVLLNTSFNVKGEPIVCTISDALRTFFATGLDVLAVGPFVIRKAQQGMIA